MNAGNIDPNLHRITFYFLCKRSKGETACYEKNKAGEQVFFHWFGFTQIIEIRPTPKATADCVRKIQILREPGVKLMQAFMQLSFKYGNH
jgi:hypothetical protein